MRKVFQQTRSTETKLLEKITQTVKAKETEEQKRIPENLTYRNSRNTGKKQNINRQTRITANQDRGNGKRNESEAVSPIASK